VGRGEKGHASLAPGHELSRVRARAIERQLFQILRHERDPEGVGAKRCDGRPRYVASVQGARGNGASHRYRPYTVL
jgi:hypothetical protein